MSIQSEISRLMQAKSDISAAIADKGVPVPTTIKMDEFASLIESIEAGGGGSVATGTVITDEMSMAYDPIYHGLGKKPSGVLWVIIESTSVNSSGVLNYKRPQAGGYFSSDGTGMYLRGGTGSSNSTLLYMYFCTITSSRVNECLTTDYFYGWPFASGTTPGYSGYMPPGSTCRWFAW